MRRERGSREVCAGLVSRLLLTAVASDTLPDVFQLDDVDVPALADRGGALDLAPYLSRVGVDLGRYDPEVVAIFRRGAGVYGLPRGYEIGRASCRGRV